MEGLFVETMETHMSNSPSAFQRRYPPELRERAVRLVHETIAESGGSPFS
jgi:transposase-like protein